jgi:hypothetical protein
MNGELSQENAISAIFHHATASHPSATAPKPTMAPTIAWVVETGSP